MRELWLVPVLWGVACGPLEPGEPRAVWGDGAGDAATVAGDLDAEGDAASTGDSSMGDHAGADAGDEDGDRDGDEGGDEGGDAEPTGDGDAEGDVDAGDPALGGDVVGVGEPCAVLGTAGSCTLPEDCPADHVRTPGYCPGPTEVQCCTPSSASECDASLRPLPNEGSTEEAAGDPGCPAGMARVEDFCIDRFEASLVVVATGATWSPYFNPGSTVVRAVSVAGAVPQGYVSGTQAVAACAGAGKRLCSDAEWLRACQGSGYPTAGTTYPYGDTRQDGLCNDARTPHPVIEYFGTTASWIWSELDHPCINQQHDTVERCGARAGCVTPEGVHDLMGNLHEWTADPAGTFRGGYYVDTRINGEGCLYRTTAHAMSHWDYSTGLRCCAAPLP